MMEPIEAIVSLCQTSTAVNPFIGVDGPFLNVAPELTAFDFMTIDMTDAGGTQYVFDRTTGYLEPIDITFHTWSQSGNAVALANARIVAQTFNRQPLFTDGTNSSTMFLKGPVWSKRERFMGPGGVEVYQGICRFRLITVQSTT